MPERIVIVGAGHAAGQLVARLKQLDFAGEIVLVGDEPWYPYQRPPLSKKFLAGALSVERLFLKPESFYSDPNISVLRDTRVESIDRTNKTVKTSDGQTLTYDTLVLAVGARPRHIDLPGADLDGVCYLRGIEDVQNIRSKLIDNCKLTIVGAGYIGLEVAAVASQMCASVTVIEQLDRVMSRVVSKEISAFYDAEHRRHGVKLLLSTPISGFSGDKCVKSVDLQNGERLETDLVLVGIGVLPNTEIASRAGLAVDNGILVDDRCQTEDPAIFAIGDCTSHPNALLGERLRLESVHNAVEQAKTAASNICQIDKHYAQIPWFWSDQYDLKLQIVGISSGYDQVIVRGDMASRSFACLYLRNGCLIAVDAVNNPKDFVQGKALIMNKAIIDVDLLANPGIALKDMEFSNSG
jgi:3-phenylpropionate/trans-cinnamate dioxygenase ferredoxin reductase subunit